jgi:Cys-tRNA synthase (O-phospho-L-seryl-tRNA:Cys-tRNA synthase)
MARAAGDISLKWTAAQEYTISAYQNLAHAAYAVGNELDLSALDNVVDLLVGSKHKSGLALSMEPRS